MSSAAIFVWHLKGYIRKENCSISKEGKQEMKTVVKEKKGIGRKKMQISKDGNNIDYIHVCRFNRQKAWKGKF